MEFTLQKLMLKPTSSSTGAEVEARANDSFFCVVVRSGRVDKLILSLVEV